MVTPLSVVANWLANFFAEPRHPKYYQICNSSITEVVLLYHASLKLVSIKVTP